MIDDDLARKLGDAGVDLGVMGIQWGERPDELPTCSITDRDVRVLRFLHDFNYASTSTLAAMFWGRYGSAVRERLKLLNDVGFVDKLRPRVGRTQGAPEWVYRLTLRGWQMLSDHGDPADREAFKRAKLTSIAYVEHDVQVAALMAQIAARAAAFVGRTGPLIDAAPFTLLGPRSGTIDPRVEKRAPDASPASDLAGRRVHLGTARPGVLKPEATMIGVDVHGNRTAVMFEFDRTRRPSKQDPRAGGAKRAGAQAWVNGGHRGGGAGGRISCAGIARLRRRADLDCTLRGHEARPDVAGRRAHDRGRADVRARSPRTACRVACADHD
ncbi:MAG: replication-relaxation family protein [Gaiellaceae bacterium]